MSSPTSSSRPAGWLLVLILFLPTWLAAATPRHVILIITDDQGYGDVGAHGNSMIRTPHLDRLHGESVRLVDYHVDPTCSPTRSALLSGRYSTRTGVWHTIMGRSMMRTEEVTLAEVFREGGYRTGMFGKWHLGDNAPLRPQDQGFDETFYHGGGGVTQTPDYWGNDYFDDIYFRDGVPEATDGYCTDVWFREAMAFIRRAEAGKRRSFTYLSTNAPHGPFLVDPSYSDPYLERGVPPTMAKFYGMITNIDENLGKLRAMLEREGIAENTLLIYTTDNGTAAGLARRREGGKADEKPTWTGFNSGMRGTKGSEYDGGHRVPFILHWPQGHLTGGRDVTELSAHIDVLPTLVELCDLELPRANPLDGTSLADLLRPENPGSSWPARTLFVHSQRLEHPRKWRKSAVMTDRYRLVNGEELYDIRNDPGQQNDLAEAKPGMVQELRGRYEAWWKSLEPAMQGEVRIAIGSDAESPSRLTAHDWHTDNRGVPWNQGHIRKGPPLNGHWSLQVERAGRYRFFLRRWPRHVDRALEAREATIRVGDQSLGVEVDPRERSVSFTLELPAGPTRLHTTLVSVDGSRRGAYFVEVRRVSP